eukprot:scaffold126397_cov16-Tisochrysis_lutea.AAC.2
MLAASTSFLKDSMLLASRSSSSRYPTTSKQTCRFESVKRVSKYLFDMYLAGRWMSSTFQTSAPAQAARFLISASMEAKCKRTSTYV